MNPIPSVAAPLLAWYDAGARDLPWRHSPTPYQVWVSEIMLQQTRVEAVKPYYTRFLETLPTPRHLARCPEDLLYKLWEGLGYYSRARNLQKAAQVMVENHGGDLPTDYSTLLSLPGIGTYTAGAIASIAFGERVAAVDGNVLRVLSRLTLDTRNILDPRVKAEYERELPAVIDPHRPGDFNQALIELGATLCGPGRPPACHACPLAEHCLAYKEGVAHTLPVREKKKPRRIQPRTVLLLRDGGRVLLHRRPQKGLLAGLYEFPAIEGEADRESILAFVRDLGGEPIRILPLEDTRHIFTHVEWHMKNHLVDLADTLLPSDTPLALSENGLTPDPRGDYLLCDPASLTEKYPIPSAFAPLTLYMGADRTPGRALPKGDINTSYLGSALTCLGTVECHEEIDSTNLRAKELARAGAPHLSLVVSRRQTGGRGRLGRTFHSPEGGLYLSLILRRLPSKEKLGLLTPLAAVVTAKAIERLCPARPQIKWVNDLLLGDKKVCGILTECGFSPAGDALWAVVGIGINVHDAPMPEELREIATSLEAACGSAPDLTALLEEIACGMAGALPSLETGEFLDFYRSRLALLGREAVVQVGDKAHSGTVTGIGDLGELLLTTPGGELLSISSGEVTKLRPI